jgi:hypothetical protein
MTPLISILLGFAILIIPAALLTAVMVFVVYKVLRLRHPLAQWLVFLGVGVAFFAPGFGGMTRGDAEMKLFFANFNPYRHLCGGPTNWDPTCDEAARLREANERVIAPKQQRYGARYWQWLMIPPPLRPACETVDPEVCAVEASQSGSSGPLVEYAFSLFVGLIPAVSSMVTTNWLFNRWGRQQSSPAAQPSITG